MLIILVFMQPIIEVKNIDFVYNRGKDNEFHALVNVSLDIYPEEFVIIFGPSGCGKSTLLNVFAGLERPDHGSINVMGRDLLTMSSNEFSYFHRAMVGMIYQQYNLITSLTVLDNVALPQIFVNVRKGKRDRWALSLLERFGIKKQANKIPTELSGGQQQRIGIARAIVNNPKIVLADEPVGNLDSTSASNVLDILEVLNEKEKKTIVLVTHNPEYLGYGDRIIYMKDGVITREVVNREKHKDIKKEEKTPKSAAAELSELMRAYHGLSPEQINILIMPYKAKIFAHHFITSRNMEETKIFEDVVQRRLLGTITQGELQQTLKRATREGGVGFDRRTADKIFRRINRVLRMAYYVYRKSRQSKDENGNHIIITNEDKAKKVTDYLLNTCYYEFFNNLDPVQINRLELTVKDRLVGQIQKPQFIEFLDKPFKKGGVGLNSKTAKAITEELELILILGFGIVRITDEAKKHNQPFIATNAEPKKENDKAEKPEEERKEGSIVKDPLVKMVQESENAIKNTDKTSQEGLLHNALLAAAENVNKEAAKQDEHEAKGDDRKN